MKNSLYFLTLTLAVSVLTPACSSELPAIALDKTNYQKPAEWQSECVGRWMLDVPKPIDFGAAYVTKDQWSEFHTYTPQALVKTLRGEGVVHVGKVAFVESAPVDQLRNDEDVRSKLNTFWRIGASLANREPSAKGFSDAQEIDLKPPTKRETAWATHGAFQVTFHSEEDDRARLFWKVPEPFDPNPDQRNPKIPPVADKLARAVLDKLVPRYTIRQPGSIPTQPGICTPLGFFADPKGATERDYLFEMYFVSPKHENLVLGVKIQTRTADNGGSLIKGTDIRKALTPWGADKAFADKQRKECRSQQGTASRDLLGCSIAGLGNIKSYAPVQYMKLSNGQEARILTMKYFAGGDFVPSDYKVMIETAGVPGSATEPRIQITVQGVDGDMTNQEPAFQGKKPPPIEEAFKLAVDLAKSLRLRPGAIAPGSSLSDFAAP